ncbi:hypothetical protein PM082_023735 [Marasmius tenuissimus]|nr:hypothetical protein PM082_023735 [Marasmius tenuissimus]
MTLYSLLLPQSLPTAAIAIDILPRSLPGLEADSLVLAVDDFPFSWVLIGCLRNQVFPVTSRTTPQLILFQVLVDTNTYVAKPQDVRLTSANVIRNPSLLTKYANSGARICLDGLVGNALSNDVLVTSPNMLMLYKPPTDLCRVQLRRDNHFGPDDLLHYPQPFNRMHAHLAVIRVKTDVVDDLPLETAWLIPEHKDFVECPSCSGLGRLDTRIRTSFASLCRDVLAKFPPEAHNNDGIVGEGSIHLKRLLDHLDAPASLNETFLRFACAQRQVLELLARFEWVSTYRTKFMGKDRGDAPGANLAIMGAFTEDYDALDSLYHAGIPVWYIRRLSNTPEVRIDKVVNFIHDTNSFKLALRFGGVLDTSDASPPHRIIYNQLAAKPERYMAMGNFIRSLFQYPCLIGLDTPRSSTSVIHTNHRAVPLCPFSAFSDKTRSSAGRSKPYASKSPRNKGGPTNPFVFSSPLLPPSVPAWANALHALSHHNLSTPPPPGHSRGYFLPPARLLVAPENDEIKLALLRNWLKVREVTIFRATRGAPCLSTKDWWSFLNISGGDTKQVSDTRSGKQYESMLTLLKDFLTENRLSLKYDELPLIKAKWKGRSLSPKQLPETRIVQQITWELNELNFRQELVALDGVLDESNLVKWDRQNLLDGCWQGRADWVNGTEGLGSESLQARIPYLTRLHKIMSTWRGDKPLELLDSFPKREAHNFLVTSERVERALASFYTSSFLSVFGREASVPYILS